MITIHYRLCNGSTGKLNPRKPDDAAVKIEQLRSRWPGIEYWTTKE